MGFISTAYSAQVHPHIALSSRFGVNIYSYESDLSIGGEWWIGRRRGKKEGRDEVVAVPPASSPSRPTSSLRVGEEEEPLVKIDKQAVGPFAQDRVDPRYNHKTALPVVEQEQGSALDVYERDGVLKARVTGNWVSTRTGFTVQDCSKSYWKA